MVITNVRLSGLQAWKGILYIHYQVLTFRSLAAAEIVLYTPLAKP